MLINSLARICLGSLIVTTVISFLIMKYQIIDRIRKSKIINPVFTAFNTALSLTSLYLMFTTLYIGVIGLYVSMLMWAVQYSRDHSVWIRPIVINGFIFIAALIVLQWFDAQPLLKKFWIVFKFQKLSLL